MYPRQSKPLWPQLAGPASDGELTRALPMPPRWVSRLARLSRHLLRVGATATARHRDPRLGGRG
jgi:hypothetical protein